MRGVELVGAAVERGLLHVVHRGARWLHADLLPALADVQDALDGGMSSYRELCAQACYVVADVHECHEAPEVAIGWYRRCLDLDPGQAAAWREIGSCLGEMGRLSLARQALARALELDPDDGFASRELHDLDHAPGLRYVDGDPVWRAAEALASNRPDEALAALATEPSARAARWRLNAHAAADDRASVLAGLEALGRAAGPVRLDDGLWFFLPDALWRDPRLWSILRAFGDRLEPAGIVSSAHPRLPRPSSRPLTPAELVALQLRALE